MRLISARSAIPLRARKPARQSRETEGNFRRSIRSAGKIGRKRLQCRLRFGHDNAARRAEASKLPTAEQDLLASRLLAEMAAEDDFYCAIAGSTDKLAQLKAEAIAEHRAGVTDDDQLLKQL